jgi:hypothetical protein
MFLYSLNMVLYSFMFLYSLLYVSVFQGILSEVLLDSKPLSPWSMTQYPLSNLSWIDTAPATNTTKLPVFYTATFTLNAEHPKPLDGYVDMSNWAKVST